MLGEEWSPWRRTPTLLVEALERAKIGAVHLLNLLGIPCPAMALFELLFAGSESSSAALPSPDVVIAPLQDLFPVPQRCPAIALGTQSDALSTMGALGYKIDEETQQFLWDAGSNHPFDPSVQMYHQTCPPNVSAQCLNA